jgi:DNA-binding response OmpR family regulator
VLVTVPAAVEVADRLCALSERLRSAEMTDGAVILLTGNQERKDVIAGLESGADDYITKPCDWEELRGGC